MGLAEIMKVMKFGIYSQGVSAQHGILPDVTHFLDPALCLELSL